MEATFPNTIGQEKARDHLKNAISTGRLPHAYLIQGPEGAGHFAFALDIALNLRCESVQKPCLKCAECSKILHNSSPNFRIVHPFPSKESLKVKDEAYWEFIRQEILSLIQNPFKRLRFEKNALISIDTMRQLQQDMAMCSISSGWQVAVICDADKMGEDAANSILKMLEEPRKGILFLVLTTRPSFLLQTIRSRCQTIRLGQLSEACLKSFLKTNEGQAHSDERISLAARFANGSLSRAIEALEGELDEAHEMAERWIDTAKSEDPQKALDLSEEIAAKRDMDFTKSVLEIVLIMIRDSCILKNGSTAFGGGKKLSTELADSFLKEVKGIISDLERNVMAGVTLYTGLRKLQKVW